MEPNAELWVLLCIQRRLPGGQPSGHQTCAGYNPTLVRCNDAPVYSRALAEIVGIDDKVFLTSHRS